MTDWEYDLIETFWLPEHLSEGFHKADVAFQHVAGEPHHQWTVLRFNYPMALVDIRDATFVEIHVGSSLWPPLEARLPRLCDGLRSELERIGWSALDQKDCP